jgi:hypothetical protein
MYVRGYLQGGENGRVVTIELLVALTYRICLPYYVYQNTNCVFLMEGQNEKLHVHKQEKSYID